MAKTGRPKEENPKFQRASCRLTAAEYEKLKSYAFNHNMTISKVVYAGIEFILKEKDCQ